MKFKIDAKSDFTKISISEPVFNVEMAAELLKKCKEERKNGSSAFLIDLQGCTHADEEALQQLLSLHEDCYSNNCSLVFTGLSEAILSKCKKNELHLEINITPTEIEAIDIISMEHLERDLFSEEDAEDAI